MSLTCLEGIKSFPKKVHPKPLPSRGQGRTKGTESAEGSSLLPLFFHREQLSSLSFYILSFKIQSWESNCYKFYWFKIPRNLKIGSKSDTLEKALGKHKGRCGHAEKEIGLKHFAGTMKKNSTAPQDLHSPSGQRWVATALEGGALTIY